VEALPIETENPLTGIGPERAIGRHVQRMDFGSAGQPFGGGHQTKACAVIAVQSAFRAGPDVTGSVLRQGEDGQVLQSLGGAIMAEAVLLGDAGAAPRQNQRSTGAEAITKKQHQLTYRPKGRGL
jgi:hypothetical protein